MIGVELGHGDRGKTAKRHYVGAPERRQALRVIVEGADEARGPSRGTGRREPESIRDAREATTGFTAEGVAGVPGVGVGVPVGNDPGARRGRAQQTSGRGTDPKAGRISSRISSRGADQAGIGATENTKARVVLGISPSTTRALIGRGERI